MKKIDIPAMGTGAQIWFTIGRLRRLEQVLHMPIKDIAEGMQGLNITYIIAIMQTGMLHNGLKSEQYYEENLQQALENGYKMADIYEACIKALVGSGVLGEETYYRLFPEELTSEAEKNLEGEAAPL